MVTEWKFYRIDFLNLPQVPGGFSDPDKAVILSRYELPQILQLRWYSRERYHYGTIKSYVEKKESLQLRNYVLGADVQ